MDVMRKEYRKLTEAEVEQVATLKSMGAGLHHWIGLLGESREVSLAQTRVEEAIMWAVKHITG